MRSIILVLSLLIALSPAAAPGAGHAAPLPDSGDLPVGDHPLGLWDGVPPPHPAAAIDTLWSLRTGFRKGITGQSIDEEQFAGPDVAVLRSGFFSSWAGLLAEFQEASLLVEPDALAGLERTKPVLIVPSGGLAGLSSSGIFRAGLAEYVRAGGIALCFSQRKGADLAALPLPEGSAAALNGAGWTEDGGPVFRTSMVMQRHPAVASLLGRTGLSIATDGHLSAYPPGAEVLLARNDGRATLVVYPVGKGWVAVSSLTSDYAFLQGAREEDERVLVRDLVLWAKSGGRIREASPGNPFETAVMVSGAEEGDTASVRVSRIGPTRERPKEDRSFPLAVKPLHQATLAYSAVIPAGTPPGIYHLEYLLLNDEKHVISPVAEASDGWFFVAPRTVLPARAPSGTPALPPPPLHIRAVPESAPSGDRSKLTIRIEREPGSSGAYGLIVRAAGQEQRISLSGNTAAATFDIGPIRSETAFAYSVHHEGGRTLAYGTWMASPAGPSTDRQSYSRGETIRLATGKLAAGELSITAPGTDHQEIVTSPKLFSIPVPSALPDGVYAVTWELQTRAGDRSSGRIPFRVRGATVAGFGGDVLREKDRFAAVTLALDSSDNIESVVTVQVKGPDGSSFPEVKQAVALVRGKQTVTVPLAILPDQAGMWQFLYRISAVSPRGPGFPREPIVLAAGRLAADAGDAAIIGLQKGRPIYYDTAERAEITAYVYGPARTKFEVRVDGNRVRKVKLAKSGVTAVSLPLEGLSRGRHTVSAAVDGADRGSVRLLPFLFGARLPDLAAVIRTADPGGPFLEVGVGVLNQGRVASEHGQVSLFDGDPAEGGTLIGTQTLAPLGPGKQQVSIFRYPLAGKAGARTLVAVANPDERFAETSRKNNRASISFDVPGLLLTLHAPKPSFSVGDTMHYSADVIRYTPGPAEPLSLVLTVTDPNGAIVSRETVSLPPLEPAAARIVERVLDLSRAREGTYLVNAVASSDKPLASDSLGITILPTLLLAGSLPGTPEIAATCRPFLMRYTVSDAGNVPAVNGTLRLEIRSADRDQALWSQQLPFTMGTGTATTEPMHLPAGDYSVRFEGSAVNTPWDLRRDFLLAQQSLAVRPPVEVTRTTGPSPRILIWSGGEGSPSIEKALAAKIVQEAFDRDSIYVTTVATAGEFVDRAQTGLYNIYVLFESNGAPGADDVLRAARERGDGIVLIGPAERSLREAEALGFRFVDTGSAQTSITFPAGSPLGLAGSVPVSGKVLSPEKKGSRPLALLAGGAPAAVLDNAGSGRTAAIPFSLTRSALNAGVSTPYSLLLRAAVTSVFAAHPGSERADSVQITYASPAGPVRARLTELQPPDTVVAWMSAPGTYAKGSLTFEVTADREPQTILYVYRRSGGSAVPSGKVFYECGGKFVSQEDGE